MLFCQFKDAASRNLHLTHETGLEANCVQVLSCHLCNLSLPHICVKIEEAAQYSTCSLQQQFHGLLQVQAELLQQEIINRVRLATAVQQLLPDLPKQAAAAEERMLMAEYVKGYQLVSTPTSASLW